MNRLSPVRLRLELLENRLTPTVTYHGGALLSSVQAQAVYLGSDWNNSTYSSQRQSLDGFVSYIVNSPFMDALNNAGYNVGRGSATTGVVDAVSLNQATTRTNPLTDSQIQSYLQNLITSGSASNADSQKLYIVYVEDGVEINLDGATSANTFLGYHSAFAGRDANGNAIDIHYAVIAYPGNPNASANSQGFNSNFSDLTAITSHELSEAVTDPNVNYKQLGWYDNFNNGEVADLSGVFTTLNGYTVAEFVNQHDVSVSLSSGTTGGGTTPGPTRPTHKHAPPPPPAPYLPTPWEFHGSRWHFINPGFESVPAWSTPASQNATDGEGSTSSSHTTETGSTILPNGTSSLLVSGNSFTNTNTVLGNGTTAPNTNSSALPNQTPSQAPVGVGNLNSNSGATALATSTSALFTALTQGYPLARLLATDGEIADDLEMWDIYVG